MDNETAREWYMHEAADQRWSTRQLDRQISTLYYERLLASQDKVSVREEAQDKLLQVQPEEFIRDPYVLEFLNLKEYPGLREHVLETAIIDNLKNFLLEFEAKLDARRKMLDSNKDAQEKAKLSAKITENMAFMMSC